MREKETKDSELNDSRHFQKLIFSQFTVKSSFNMSLSSNKIEIRHTRIFEGFFSAVCEL